jgi:hypothetical protein
MEIRRALRVLIIQRRTDSPVSPTSTNVLVCLDSNTAMGNVYLATLDLLKVILETKIACPVVTGCPQTGLQDASAKSIAIVLPDSVLLAVSVKRVRMVDLRRQAAMLSAAVALI